MTVKEAAAKWKMSERKIKNNIQYIDGVDINIKPYVIPDNARKIYIPDKRGRKSKYYGYINIMDAVVLKLDVNLELLEMDESEYQTVIRELSKMNMIILKKGKKPILNHLDYIVDMKYQDWDDKKTEAKRKLIMDLSERIAAGVARVAIEAYASH